MTPIGIQYSYLIPLLPLLGAAVAGFLGARWLKGKSHWPIWLGVGAAAVLSFTILFGMLGKLHHGAIVKAELKNSDGTVVTDPDGSPAMRSSPLPYPFTDLVHPPR